MKMVEVEIPEWRDKKGKCLNCGKITPFYNDGYFCTYDCCKEYKNRDKVTFQEAFKAYEEGKEIESCESGYKYFNDEGKCYIQAPKENDWTRWVEDTFELEEIRGEWYIN